MKVKVAKLEIVRVYTSYDHGTFSTVLLNGKPFCVGLEPMDLCDEKNLSCIPEGKYVAIPYKSPKYGKCWLVTGTRNRTFILIHPGNIDDDTKGCLLLASHYGKLKGDLAVLNSGATYKRFMSETMEKGYTHLHLHYRNVWL